jgi:hypothetical protein
MMDMSIMLNSPKPVVNEVTGVTQGNGGHTSGHLAQPTSPRRARSSRLIDSCITQLQAKGPILGPVSRVIKKKRRTHHDRGLEISTFDIFQRKSLECSNQRRQIWRG